jgi:ABC-type multidrug transport system ATPase subunit
MSEEILKALMQFFAIISKQDDGMTAQKREYVKAFLQQQLNEDQVEEYLELFEGFAKDKKKRKKEGEDDEEAKKKKLTSVGDSVRILGICKKINKKLTQKQKVVVLVRLFELVNADRNFSEQRMAIISTAAKVFNIDKEEHAHIEKFIVDNDIHKTGGQDFLIIDDALENVSSEAKFIPSSGLDHPVVVLKISSVNLYFIKYTGASDIYLNNRVLANNRIYLFANGGIIKPPIGTPVYYSDVAAHFLADSATVNLSFNAKNIGFTFKTGDVGLRDLTISEGPGKLLGIMGASGAGKTTLLNVLSGQEEPTEGAVLINGIDSNKDKKKIEGVIGYVPQDDLLIEELTVFQNLYYNAKLCFKGHSDQEIVSLVLRVIDNLGLKDTKDLKVGNPLEKIISGGQRKRLNIGLELIREPSVMFLDEPTSGLSSRDSENVIDLLRELTLKGKLIFVVIHQPSSDIYKMFDKIILLDVGGYLIYYGNPVEAITYFKRMDHQINSGVGECEVCGNVNPEILFNVTESKIVDELGQHTDKRKVLPHQWNEYYKQNFEQDEIEDVDEVPPRTLNQPSKLAQWWLFFKRDILSKLSNKQYLFINLLEAPLLAFFLSFIIRYVADPNKGVYVFRENENIPAYLFICIVVSLFIGLMVSAEEIFRDRKILKREAFLNLSRSSYLLSKVAILFILSAIQTFLFVLIGNTVLGIEGMFLDYWLVLFSITCSANLLGLNISASFNSAVTIYIIIPLLIIPQMVLGGAMFSYDKLNSVIGGGKENTVPIIADFIPARWAYEALMVDQFMNNEYGKEFYDISKKESVTDYKQAYYIPALQQKLSMVRKQVKTPADSLNEKYKYNLALLKNEVASEMKKIKKIKFTSLNKLTPAKFDTEVASELEDYLGELKSFYAKSFIFVSTKKEFMKDKKYSGMSYKELYDNHYNDYLADVVKKSMAKEQILDFEGRLIQQIDPIFIETQPRHALDYRAPFFAPNKNFLNNSFSTLTFNVLVIWTMTILLYITLYFNILKKFMGLFGKIRFNKKR